MGSASRAVSCLCCPCKCLACGLFSCLCSILISLLVTVGLLALVFYLIFRPHMIAATVDSAALTQFNLTSNSALTYALNVDLTVRNPNKRVGLYYDNVESLAFFDSQRFGFALLDPFYQSTEATTKLSPSFKGQQLLEGDITAANFRSQETNGKFDIEVKLNAKLRVKVWAFKVPGPKAKISCPITVPKPAPNAPAFQPTDCKVWF